MKKMSQIILLILTLAIAASAYSLWANKVPWNDPPGFFSRLTVYLTQNVAESSDHPRFPELRTRTYPKAVKPFMDEIMSHIIALGWNLQSVDPDQLTLTATVQTRWLMRVWHT